MKSIASIYRKLFMQVWIFVLSALVFISGILLLTDLRNYRYIISEGYGANSVTRLDEQGKNYTTVWIKCTTKFVYGRNSTAGYLSCEVSCTSGYEAENDGIYLDIYETKDGELVFLKTVHAYEYSENFYDLEYARGIKIVPRLGNVKYKYPAWRIYVPILIFMLSLPIMSLSGYLIVTGIVEKVRLKIESETPIEE